MSEISALAQSDVPKVGIIGLGSMGMNHARVLSDLPIAALVAVSDVSQERLAMVTKGRYIKGYSDYREMIEAEQLDALIIAVPTSSHYEVAKAAIERHIPTLVEKPLAASAAEARELAVLASSQDVLLSVGHIERFNPAIQELRQRMRDGQLGKIFRIVARRVGPFPERIRDVGVTRDLATHDIDIARFLSGREVVSAYAVTAREIHTAHEDLLSGILQLDGGISLLLDVNWLTPTKIRELLVLGEQGMFQADYLTQDLYLFENDVAGERPGRNPLALSGVTEGAMTRIPLQKREPLKVELERFLSVVVDGGPSPVPADDAVRTLEVAELLLQSARCGKVVRPAESPQPSE